MVILLRAAWLLQAVTLFFVGGALIIGYDPMFVVLDISDADMSLARLFAPLGLGLGALTFQVLGLSFNWLREALSTVFFSSWLFGTIIALWTGAPWPVVLVCAVFAGCNLAYALRPVPVPAPVSARPSASDEAPLLGRAWGLQMVYYTACAAVALIAPEWAFDHLIDLSDDFRTVLREQAGPVGQWVSDAALRRGVPVLRTAAALYLSIALVSHHAIGAQSDETWRGYCRAFLAAQWACAVAMVVALVMGAATFSPWTMLVILPNVAFGMVNTLTLYDRRWIRRTMGKVWDSLPVWWTIQAGLFLVAMGISWLDSDGVLALFTPATSGIPDNELSLARGTFQLIAPLGLALFALTLIGLLRVDRRSRFQFSGLFLTWGFMVLVVRVANDQIQTVPDDSFFYWVLGPVFLVLSLLVAGVNLLVRLFPDWASAEQQYQGAADTKPRWIYRFCVTQAVVFGVITLIVVVWPESLTSWLLKEPLGEDGPHALTISTLRVTAPFWAIMSASMLYTASSPHEWAWRGLCRWAAVWQLAYIIVSVYSFDAEILERSLIIWPALLGLAAVLNLNAAATPLRHSDLAGQPRPAGWLASDAGPGLPMWLSTVVRRQRAYHRSGVVTTGAFFPSPGSALLETDFFAPRDVLMLCTLRFSNAQQSDDAALDARGCAVRLSWSDSEDTMDLLLSTGSFAAVSSVFDVTLQRLTPTWIRRRISRKNHAHREAAVAALRRAPDSYAHLRYYGQLVRLWVGTNEQGETESRRCRVRMVPWDGESESGLPDAADEDAAWPQPRRPDEARSARYLYQELEARLEDGPIGLLLQAQIAPGAGDGALSNEGDGAWFDAAVDWSERDMPWHNIGSMMLDGVLSDQATDALRFDPSAGAGVFATPQSASWRDPRSLAAAQERVIRVVGSMRMWVTRIFGSAADGKP